MRLLLEAGGPDRNIRLHIPIGYYRTILHPRFKRGHETEPDPGLNRRKVPWPRGLVLGGSSAINGLVYIRGQKEDFDHWRQLGNPGWSYDDVLPYFKRAEDQERGADAFHGAGGPLNVADFPEEHTVSKAIVEACVSTSTNRIGPSGSRFSLTRCERRPRSAAWLRRACQPRPGVPARRS